MKIIDLLETNFLTDEYEIIKWMKKSFDGFNPKKLKIEPDGLVYDGHLDLKNNVNELKVKFKSVTDFFSYYALGITTLAGCPETVGGYFTCSYTIINSLKFCPKSIGNTFYCNKTKIADPKEYRYALYSEIGGKFESGIDEIDDIINNYSGSVNRKYWPHAINLLSKVQL